MQIHLVDPKTKDSLIEKDNALLNASTNKIIAPIINGIPRFVSGGTNYAESFGWQWNHWEHVRSLKRGNNELLENTILNRTQFDSENVKGKTILECGMGGGDDTEILLKFPFSEIHSFDLSSSVDRAHKYLKDPRLVISQSSIYEIPYEDYIFDIVYCHRVLQHTPDPVHALQAVCKKVKPGGILFAHAYKRSWRHMLEWRYKYRWITIRMNNETVYRLIDKYGTTLHNINKVLYRLPVIRFFAYNFVPFYYKTASIPEDQKIEYEKLNTFDALTPRYDYPMKPSQFFDIIEQEGFKITNKYDPLTTPMFCTAIRKQNL